MTKRRSSRLTIIFDLETTGFAPMPMYSKYHRVIQICAMCLETQAFFAEFVDAGLEIPKASTATHKIHTRHVQRAADTPTVMRRMFKFFNFDAYEEVIMIAHNCRWFDQPVLLKEYYNMGDTEYVPTNVKFSDTLPWFRKKFVGLKVGFSLGALHKHFFGSEIKNAHRADADVKALSRLYNEVVVPRGGLDIVDEHQAVVDECLPSLYYIGAHRAWQFIDLLGVQTVSQLRTYFKTHVLAHPTALDDFLIDHMGLRNITHRMLIITQILEIPAYTDEIRPYLNIYVEDGDCLDCVDYFVKYRYFLNERAPNQCHYQRGLMAVKNKKFV